MIVCPGVQPGLEPSTPWIVAPITLKNPLYCCDKYMQPLFSSYNENTTMDLSELNPTTAYIIVPKQIHLIDIACKAFNFALYATAV